MDVEFENGSIKSKRYSVVKVTDEAEDPETKKWVARLEASVMEKYGSSLDSKIGNLIAPKPRAEHSKPVVPN